MRKYRIHLVGKHERFYHDLLEGISADQIVLVAQNVIPDANGLERTNVLIRMHTYAKNRWTWTKGKDKGDE